MGKKSDSHINRTDNCSTGNKEAGLVNSWEYSRIPQSVMKTQTNTNLYFSINGVPKLSCCYPIYPKITSVSPNIITSVPTLVTVYGSNFIPGAEVKLENSSGVVNGGYEIVSLRNKIIKINITNIIISDPFNIKVKNPSGLSFTYPDALEFKTYSFSLQPNNDGDVTLEHVTEYDSGIDIDLGMIQGAETDVTFTYEIGTGTLPGGLNLDISTGKITGTVNAGTADTYNFSVKYTITDNGVSEEKTRHYILTVDASTGSGDGDGGESPGDGGGGGEGEVGDGDGDGVGDGVGVGV
jgi:hypothetical protein